MGITLNLSPQLEQELIREAKRDEIAPVERVGLLLRVTLALRTQGPVIPFGSAVRVFFRQRGIDPDRLALALDPLNGACIPVTFHSKSGPLSEAELESPGGRVYLDSLLRRWREDEVYRPAEEGPTAPAEDRSRRLLDPGKFADIGLSSEDFMREKQEEIDREDRVF